MKTMLSKQLQNCLKTGLKKSNVYKATIAILIFFLQPALLSGISIDHRYYSHENTLSLLLSLRDFPVDEVKQVFQKGQTSEIQYEIRLYRETKGILSFLGDELIEEQSITYNGRFNPFYNAYQIETKEETTHYIEEESFFRAFQSNLTVVNNPAKKEPSLDHPLYFRVRITFNPRKLMPPLNVLEPFLIDNQESTGWVRIPLTRKENSL